MLCELLQFPFFSSHDDWICSFFLPSINCHEVVYLFIFHHRIALELQSLQRTSSLQISITEKKNRWPRSKQPDHPILVVSSTLFPCSPLLAPGRSAPYRRRLGFSLRPCLLHIRRDQTPPPLSGTLPISSVPLHIQTIIGFSDPETLSTVAADYHSSWFACLLILMEIFLAESGWYSWMAKKRSFSEVKQKGPLVEQKRQKLRLSDLPVVWLVELQSSNNMIYIWMCCSPSTILM